VAVTAPYFHDGGVDALQDAVQHAARGVGDAEEGTPLLQRSEVDDLVAFLLTLTDPHGSRRPWNPAGLTGCP
jgi:cytochrome c peroxidase